MNIRPRPELRPNHAWVTRREAVGLILSGVTFHTASRVALVVGTLLALRG